MPDNPNPPDCIADALYRQLGPIETDHEERRIDEIAQAVWDRLLTEGWFAPWTSPKFDRVLVIPIRPGQS